MRVGRINFGPSSSTRTSPSLALGRPAELIRADGTNVDVTEFGDCGCKLPGLTEKTDSERVLAALDDLSSDESMTPEERLNAIRAILQAHFTITDPATKPPYK